MKMSFDAFTDADLAGLAGDLPGFDDGAAQKARDRQNSLTKPPGSLGRLEELAVFMAGWQGRDRPTIDHAQAVVFAGNHGVCAQGVNPFPQEVTAQMVLNFKAGGAAVNQLCAVAGAELSVVPMDLDNPTNDITVEPAMRVEDTRDAMRRGAEVVDPKADILILGEMGIGNSTIAAALACGAFGGDASSWVGRGTGSDEDGLKRKANVVAAAVARHRGAHGIQLLAALGGREQAAICGAVLQARALGIPVILDGFICTAATVPLFTVDPSFLQHCVVGHVSREPGHQKLLNAIGKDPILSLDMALGEGSGAALALGVLRSALACHNGMATFAEAGVSDG